MGAFNITVNGNTEQLVCVYEDCVRSARIWMEHYNGANIYLLRTPMCTGLVLDSLRQQQVKTLFIRKPRRMGWTRPGSGYTNKLGGYPGDDRSDIFSLAGPLLFTRSLCGESISDGLYSSIYVFTESRLLRIYAPKSDTHLWFLFSEEWGVLTSAYSEDEMYKKLRTGQLAVKGPEALYGREVTGLGCAFSVQDKNVKCTR